LFLFIFFFFNLLPPCCLYLSPYLHNNSIRLNLCTVQHCRATKPEGKEKKQKISFCEET
jgi:hypothetical protein